MATFSIQNFGCRATEADASALRRQLLACGLSLDPDHYSADVVVLNTCTVTAAADAEARELVRKIRRSNPGGRIVVTGCYAQRAPEEIAAIEGVSWVIGNSHLTELPSIIRELLAGHTDLSSSAAMAEDEGPSLVQGPAKILTGEMLSSALPALATLTPDASILEDRTRPILKIQDGCNHRCSYCVIPFVRGGSRSLAPHAVVREVQTLVAVGAKEVVLSGINLGSYGRDLMPRSGLAHVVRRILDETEVEQIRFSSIEPQDITEDFVGLIASSDRLAPHFHVPLQSGCDRILRAMHRWYRAAQYAERIRLIRRLVPQAAIGADVIVGFSGEADTDFEATVDLVKRLPFTYLHVFSFSSRPGTTAAALGDAVPPDVIRERARSLRGLARVKTIAFRESLAGQTLRALTLKGGGDDWTEAVTGNYVRVRIAGRHPANEWHAVRITAAEDGIAPTSPL